jgi:hypothetical protein
MLRRVVIVVLILSASAYIASVRSQQSEGPTGTVHPGGELCGLLAPNIPAWHECLDRRGVGHQGPALW